MATTGEKEKTTSKKTTKIYYNSVDPVSIIHGVRNVTTEVQLTSR
jgi:hypothetical protein